MTAEREARLEPAEAAGRVAHRLRRTGSTAAAAESVTGGNVSRELAAAEAAAEWFQGGVVAYAADVKFRVLGVTPGPVITARAAQEMAGGAATLLAADFAVATTGAGGPGGQEGQTAGTVFIAVATPTGSSARRYQFPGEPQDVVVAATAQALQDLDAAIATGSPRERGTAVTTSAPPSAGRP